MRLRNSLQSLGLLFCVLTKNLEKTTQCIHCGLGGSSEEGNDSHASLPENLGNARQTLRAADIGVLGSRGDGWVVGGA